MNLKELGTIATRKIELAVAPNWPTVATVGGVAGLVGAMVLAVHVSVKKLPDIVEARKARAEEIETAAERGIPEDIIKKDKLRNSAGFALDVVKAYSPVLALEGVSIISILSAHGEMNRRNAAMVAAYESMAIGLRSYRDRVAEKLGEEEESRLYLGTSSATIEGEEVNPETGRKRKTHESIDILGGELPPKTLVFEEFVSTPEGEPNIGSRRWVRDMATNRFSVQTVQNYMNDRLQICGWVSVNEVLEELGFDRIPSGQYWGWVAEEGVYIDLSMKTIYRSGRTGEDGSYGHHPALLLELNYQDVPLHARDSKWFKL